MRAGKIREVSINGCAADRRILRHPRRMATITERLPENAAGRFYVDSSCIDCDSCRALAPEFFARSEDAGLSYLKRQPATAEELALIKEAMDSCPTGSIGDDGG